MQVAFGEERHQERPRLRWSETRLRSQRQGDQEMRYTFKCSSCGCGIEVTASMSEGPPNSLSCCCGGRADRDWQADSPMLDTSACRDHDHIPHEKRVARSQAPRSAAAEEAKFQSHLDSRRKQLSDGGNRGSFRHTHSVPADLYHGKMKETGDKNYWQDPANLKRHSSTKVD